MGVSQDALVWRRKTGLDGISTSPARQNAKPRGFRGHRWRAELSGHRPHPGGAASRRVPHKTRYAPARSNSCRVAAVASVGL